MKKIKPHSRNFVKKTTRFRLCALIFPLAVIYYFAEKDYTMAESKLRTLSTLSVDFAVQILNLVIFPQSAICHSKRRKEMKKWFKFIFTNALLLFLSLFLSGCLLPHTIEVAPAIRGQIADKYSGKGICGAEITYIIKAENQYSEIAVSDKNGYFQTKAPTQWLYIVYLGSPGFYPVPDKYYVIEKQLYISKDGYIPKHIVLSKAPTDAWEKTDFGVIKLSPQVP